MMKSPFHDWSAQDAVWPLFTTEYLATHGTQGCSCCNTRHTAEAGSEAESVQSSKVV